MPIFVTKGVIISEYFIERSVCQEPRSLIFQKVKKKKRMTRVELDIKSRYADWSEPIQNGVSRNNWQKNKPGLPWWRSSWESACQCRGRGHEPWSGRIPHAAEQLSPWATTTEPVRLEPVLRNKRGRGSERPVHRDEEWPLLAATGESPHTETKTQHSQKINKYKLKKKKRTNHTPCYFISSSGVFILESTLN